VPEITAAAPVLLNPQSISMIDLKLVAAACHMLDVGDATTALPCAPEASGNGDVSICSAA
jgi:hypothetical protein